MNFKIVTITKQKLMIKCHIQELFKAHIHHNFTCQKWIILSENKWRLIQRIPNKVFQLVVAYKEKFLF